MKLVEHFTSFLSDEVNLNATRVSRLEDSVEAIKAFIRNADWQPTVKGFTTHGSWAHKTIIKPVDGRAFDADLIVNVAHVPGWTAKQYISTLRAVFADSATYSDKVRRYSHCVTIEYAGERKIDIAPCVIGRITPDEHEVCNFTTDQFERSEPDNYTTWLVQRNSWTANNSLRKVTRLLKYLRDIKDTFTCPSILLTTILGSRISIQDSADTSPFADVPSALKTIVTRLDVWLQANTSKPLILNPELSSEVLSDLWSDDQYSNFRDRFHTYREWIDDAYDEPDRDESIGKWRRVFGDAFAQAVTLDKALRISEEARQLTASTALTPPGFIGDLVSLFLSYGRRALPAGFDRLPHKQRPMWKILKPPLFSIKTVARYHTARTGGTWLKTIDSGDGPLSRGHWLQFFAQTAVGGTFNNEFVVKWRVTNTDKAAQQANCLRGGFEPSNDGSTRWENLQYRGVHQVETFIIRARDNVQVAQSEPFYVVVD